MTKEERRKLREYIEENFTLIDAGDMEWDEGIQNIVNYVDKNFV